jgi:hypothetical protein
MRMCDFEDMSINEAAAILGRRPDSVRRRLARLHDRMKSALNAQGDTELELRSLAEALSGYPCEASNEDVANDS